MKYPCLVLDHDDTVVQSEATVNYPYFCEILKKLRPGMHISLQEYVHGCFSMGFAQMCKEQYNFSPAELKEEHEGWLQYAATHIPPPYPGIEQIIHRQKENGGLLCVVSHSCRENIERDYWQHFHIYPDEIFGWEYAENQRKPSPYPLIKIMEKYNLTCSDLYVVDDMQSSYPMCKATGVSLGFAAWGRQMFPEILHEMENLCGKCFPTTKDLETFLFD